MSERNEQCLGLTLGSSASDIGRCSNGFLLLEAFRRRRFKSVGSEEASGTVRASSESHCVLYI